MYHNWWIISYYLGYIMYKQVAGHLTPISAHDETMRLSLARCIARASAKNFHRFEIITISLGPTSNETNFSQSSSLDAMLLPELYTKEMWTLLVKQPSGRPSVFKGFSYLSYAKSTGYILQLRSWREIDLHLDNLKGYPSWNPHAKFIVISSYTYKLEERGLEYITKQMWHSDVLNGVILIPDKTSGADFSIYSWFPYADGSCGDKFNKMEIIDTCTNGEMQTRSNWFPNKLPKKMNNCSVRVRTIDYPPYIVKPPKSYNNSFYRISRGLEAQLLNYVAYTCNLFMRYEIVKNEAWGDISHPPNASHGIIGALVRGEADVGVGSFSATWQRHSLLDSTAAYFQDSIGFCVPHADEASQWQKLTQVMTGQMWFAITVTMVSVSVVTKQLSKRCVNRTEWSAYSEQGSVIQKVIAIVIGHAINIQPKSTQVRLFLLLWILFSMCLDVVYQTYLMSILAKTQYKYQMKTVDDILDSDLEILFRPQDLKYYDSQSPRKTRHSKDISGRAKECEDLDLCLRRTAYKKDSVIAAARLYIEYAKARYFSKTGKPLLYCIQEQIVSFPVVAYMRHGYPLRQRIDDVISHINSAGYIQRFEGELFQRRFSSGFKNETYEEEDFLDIDIKEKLLMLEHIQPIFFMACASYIISGFIFLMEILIFTHGNDMKELFRRHFRRKYIDFNN